MKRLLLSSALTALLGVTSVVAFDQADLSTLRSTNACVGCDLSEAFLRLSVFNGADMSAANLEDTIFLETSAIGAIFVNAAMTGVGVDNTSMRDADFSGATMIEANFTNADLRSANFAGTDLTGAHFTGSSLNGADLTGANLTDAVLDRSFMNATNLADANLTGATFTRMSLETAIFCRTIMPDGTLRSDMTCEPVPVMEEMVDDRSSVERMMAE